MARIAGVSREDAADEIRMAYEGAARKFGRLPEPLTITAHHPAVFGAYMGYERGLGRADRVDARLKSLASVKVASLVGCPF